MFKQYSVLWFAYVVVPLSPKQIHLSGEPCSFLQPDCLWNQIPFFNHALLLKLSVASTHSDAVVHHTPVTRICKGFNGCLILIC